MKKAGLIVATLMLAGTVAMAVDPVYSVNTVGYQKLSVANGFNFFANNWNVVGGSEEVPIQQWFSKTGLVAGYDVTDADVIYVWDGTQYQQYFLLADDNMWYKFGGMTPTTDTVARGSAVWLKHVGSTTNTIVSGEVPTEGTNIVNFAAGFTMFGSAYTSGLQFNGANVTWTGTSGYDVTDADVIYVWDGTQYQQYFLLADDNMWYKFGGMTPTTDSLAMGQGAFYKAIGTATLKEVKPY